MKQKHLIDIKDLSVKEIDQLIKVANDIITNEGKYSHKCDGKILATLFFEPSTRTRLSFESAMLRLGGNVLGFSEASSSSISKGESVKDTIKVVGYYSDIIVMRHPKEGAPLVASMSSDVPIINAGDGGHNHPTQTLTDLLTISCEKKRLNNLTIGLCGDLWYVENIDKVKQLNPDVVFWPVYTDFNSEEWNTSEKYEYASQASKFCDKVLYVNSVCKDKGANEIARGGSAFFENGSICREVPSGKEAILLIEI